MVVGAVAGIIPLAIGASLVVHTQKQLIDKPKKMTKKAKSKKAWLKKQIKDERMSSKMYRKKGFPQIAKDEAKHVKILNKELKRLM